MPPLILAVRESLEIKLRDVRADGFPSNFFITDGATVNTMVFEVSVNGEPAPDGTVVHFEPVEVTRSTFNITHHARSKWSRQTCS
jgi:hypothetical protein